MSTFGENLRRLRKERKLSMDALAEKAGTSKQVLSRYENGERVPKISMVQKLADALGVSISELSEETLDIKARIKVPPYHDGLADRIVDHVLSQEDDELMRELEAIRRDPERRRLFKRASHSDIDEVRQANAILDALKETKR